MIYTSYFANMKKIPKEITAIAICGKSPEWYKGLEYKKLAPKYQFFMEWKQNKDNDFYVKCFKEQVLESLNFNDVIRELIDLSNSKDIVLLCYEKNGEFCHRHIVAEWFNENGLKVIEI